MEGDLRLWQMVRDLEGELVARRHARIAHQGRLTAAGRGRVRAAPWVRVVRLPRVRLTVEVGRLA